MEVKIYVDWGKDGEIERERTAELVKEILNHDYPIDVKVEQY